MITASYDFTADWNLSTIEAYAVAHGKRIARHRIEGDGNAFKFGS